MPQSYVSYPGDGSTRGFNVPFPYLSRAHIRVGFGWDYFDDSLTTELLEPADYTWISSTRIQLTTAPASGAELTILRQTPKNNQLVQWVDGSALQASDHNLADQQALYLLQELIDRSRFAALSEAAIAADYASQAGYAQNAGSASRAARLTTPRNINGVPFDGTASITITAKPDDQRPNVFYVRGDGSDQRDGRNPHNAFRNIEHAIDQINAFQLPQPWAVVLLDGLSTGGELDVPDDTTIIGANFQRRTIIQPIAGREVRNVFRCGNGSHLVNLKFVGWQIDDFNNPTRGFAMTFRPGATILPGGVPYGQNCVVSSAGGGIPTPLPVDAPAGNPKYPKGGGCVLADASVLSPYSVYPNIMTWGFTPSCPNGLGYVARNRGFVNPVNAIGVGQHRHFMCLDGGQMVVSGSSSQFGDYSFWSEGSTQRIVPLKVTPSLVSSQNGVAAIIAGAKSALVNDAWQFLVANHGAGSWPAGYEALTRKDSGLFLDAVSSALSTGYERPMLHFAEGMFGFDGVCVYDFTYHTAFKAAWDRITSQLIAGGQLSAGSVTFLNALVSRLRATLDNYWYEVGAGPPPTPVEPVRRKLRSLITAINHQWTAPMAGIEFYRVPPARDARRIQRSIVQRNGGRVRFSGQDDAGNAVFVGGLVIDARSGQLGGPPFDSAIRGRVTRAVISRSY